MFNINKRISIFLMQGSRFLVVVILLVPSSCFCTSPPSSSATATAAASSNSNNHVHSQIQQQILQENSHHHKMLLDWNLNHPIYEGIISDDDDSIHNHSNHNKQSADNILVLLKTILIDAHDDAAFSQPNVMVPSPPQQEHNSEEIILNYSIFRGRSALRDLLHLPTKSAHTKPLQQLWAKTINPPQGDLGIVGEFQPKLQGHSLNNQNPEHNKVHNNNNNNEDTNTVIIKNMAAMYRMCAVLLLLKGYGDVAHEVVLGVTPYNLEEAEYAATHPGQTNWTQQHPLSTSADMIHSTIHRLEGLKLGEGNHTGYENAKYWYCGGPKCLTRPASHPVRTALIKYARQHTPLCVKEGVIAGPSGTHHSNILTSCGKKRSVFVPEGEWDGLTFIDLCQQRLVMSANGCEDDYGQHSKMFENEEQQTIASTLEKEIASLQRAELLLLVRSELIDCLQICQEINATL